MSAKRTDLISSCEPPPQRVRVERADDAHPERPLPEHALERHRQRVEEAEPDGVEERRRGHSREHAALRYQGAKVLRSDGIFPTSAG